MAVAAPLVIPATEAVWTAVVAATSALGVALGFVRLQQEIEQHFSTSSCDPVQHCAFAQSSSDSSAISPDDLKGKTEDEIRRLAKDKGLVQDTKKPNKYRDPKTGKERLRIDPGHIDPTTGKPYDNPSAARPHVHGYDEVGEKIRDPETNDPHFPLIQ